MRRSNFKWYTLYTLIMVFLLVFVNGIITYAQTAESSFLSLPEFIKTLGLSKEKTKQTLKLTRDFLTQLQDANTELTKLMTPPQSGSQADPKAKEKFTHIKLKFGVQMNKYHLDLEKLIGAAKALRIAEKIHLIIPQVLIEGLKMPGMNQNGQASQKTTPTPTPGPTGAPLVNTILTGSTSSGTNNPAPTNKTTTTTIVTPTTKSTGTAPQELPLGSLPPDSSVTSSTGTSGATGTTDPSSNLDLQIVGNSSSASDHDHGHGSGNGNGNGNNGMDGMMSMMGGMMGSMGNMSNNNQVGNGMDLINRQLVLQLLANNAAIIQMLATLSYQVGNEKLPLLLQPIYQLLANQASLIQMLYSNFNTAMTSGSSSSGGMGMM